MCIIPNANQRSTIGLRWKRQTSRCVMRLLRNMVSRKNKPMNAKMATATARNARGPACLQTNRRGGDV